ncbi:MAG TPA: HNH endonuclease signature motif containing protein [Geminicoccus sp.]|uniref:HNH endonuclease n=1 Tax=Geminicoccus sp. TaxID=2024832 RepID=UPI002B8F5590|nr:HNH endonuclease signature motif containing protein [Geminicoccus sp.]HWL69446.1 HNH endonuclease signature motif containing protein [Geminicoccus sp.]
MTDFLAKAPTLDANWRAVVLFGRNVASYKFALAKTLLGFSNRADDRVPLEELALPFARHLCEHLTLVDKQTTSRSSKFLDACRAFNRGELPQDELVGTTARLGFTNVIDAFHVVGSGPVPICFFEDERKGSRGAGAIRLTDHFRRLAASMQGGSLADEVEARWRLVEMAWQLELPRAGIAVQADAAQDLLFVEQDRRVRRTSLTRVRGALNGYQRGCCFYCRADTPLAATDVDHFFPWTLKERGAMPDADCVWNLVLACQHCNRGEGGKSAGVPSPRLIARLHERNNWLVDSHHPLRETILLQTGADADARASFLRARQRIALDALVHEWEPAGVSAGG